MCGDHAADLRAFVFAIQASTIHLLPKFKISSLYMPILCGCTAWVFWTWLGPVDRFSDYIAHLSLSNYCEYGDKID